MLREAQDIGKEAVLGDVDANELGSLVQHDHQADSRLEAGQHRCGDEVRHEPQLQEPRREKHRADQRGQRGGRHDKLRGVAVRHDQSELRAVRIASVAVELTLSTRDEPSNA